MRSFFTLSKVIILITIGFKYIPSYSQEKIQKPSEPPPQVDIKQNETTNDVHLLTHSKSKIVSIFDHTHSRWNDILKKYVSPSNSKSSFKYKELSKNSTILNKYLDELSTISEKEFNQWNRDQQIAFLINAYNAFTIRLILDNYPVTSIKKIGSFFSSPWKIQFFTLFGAKQNLDNIEHDILRKRYREPRIHFAVNCASIGCPALRAEAFVAEKLNAQLSEQTQNFLNDKSRNYIDGEILYLSKIFDWFKEDFTFSDPTVQSFVSKYISSEPSSLNKLKSNQFKIKYTPYDWNLNE